MQPTITPFSAPARHSNGSLRQTTFDGEFYDDDLPPELYDEDEDMEDLQAFVHAAAMSGDEF
ncbi:MAG: hypothetical protein ACXU8U_01450 [Asticcacaulis sp.]